MGFGYDWRLRAGSRAGQRAVGNALCVAMSRAVVQAALHLYAGTPATMTPTMFADPEQTIQIPNAVPIPLTAEQESPATMPDDRLRTIESLVRGLREAGASAAL